MYENGFYYPLSILPSPVASDNGELTQCITNFNYVTYRKKCEEFLSAMGHSNDINCCKRIVEFIFESMKR